MERIAEEEGSKTDYDFSALPPHACSYCGNHDPRTVAKCLYPPCQRWFCNSKGVNLQSHLIEHLIRAEHFQFQLHPQNTFVRQIRCFICKQTNIFALGQIWNRQNRMEIVCRDGCLIKGHPKLNQFDTVRWRCLIDQGEVIQDLLRVPSAEQDAKAKKITSKQIIKLERDTQRFRANLPGLDFPLKKIEKVYKSINQYFRIYSRLICEQEIQDRLLNSNKETHGVTIRWERTESRFTGTLTLMNNLRLSLCNIIDISHPDHSRFSARAIVSKVENRRKVKINILQGGKNIPPRQQGFIIKPTQIQTTFERIVHGLKLFPRGGNRFQICKPPIKRAILGKFPPKISNLKKIITRDFSAPGLPRLNSSQNEAIARAVQSDFSLIQGPPGTGKTLTSASLVYYLCQSGRGKVMTCAPSNTAVDNLALEIEKTGLKVVRIFARVREGIPSRASHLGLHEIILNYSNEEFKNLDDKRRNSFLNAGEYSRWKKIQKEYVAKAIANADVVSTTCISSFDPRIVRYGFPSVVIDEATQATEPECLLPILHQTSKVVIVGDHKQLGPVVLSRQAASLGLSVSMFQRLVLAGYSPFQLDQQYRMHPEIAVFPSITFYEGVLKSGVQRASREYPGLEGLWPQRHIPMLFSSVLGSQEHSRHGKSFINQQEVRRIDKFVAYLLKAGVHPNQIGIITPYEGQREFLTDFLSQKSSAYQEIFEQIEISSVDGFQGREKDFIIFSCVRSNNNIGIGFTGHAQRLNVAVTRAKFGLIIVGNSQVLSRNRVWNHLLYFCQELGILVEGEIGSFRIHNVTMRQPHPLSFESDVFQDPRE